MADRPYRSATRLAADIRDREVSPTEVVDATLERIDRLNDEFNAVVHRRDEAAREEAAEADRSIEAGDAVGPLHGVPIALKDLDSFIEGMPHTYGGVKPIGELMPEQTSVIVQRLIDAGAVVVGSTNSPEFGVSGDTTNPMYGSTGNPFDAEMSAGGSSGGSAAALGTGMVPLALGSDVAGSLRIPASACGVFGLKPTTGLVPTDFRPNAFRHEAPYASKGGMARTVGDVALLLDIIEGFHPRDPLCVDAREADYRDAVGRPIDDLSIGYSPEFGLFDVEPEVLDRVSTVAQTLEGAGATVERVEVDFGLPFEQVLDSYFAILLPELSAGFEGIKREMGIDLLGDHRDDLSPHLVDYAERGHEYSAVESKAANVVRTQVYDTIQRRLDQYDLLLTPTLAIPPFEKGRHVPEEINGAAVERPYADLKWALTWPVNLTGHPAASVPAGFSSSGLPIGAQLVGPRYGEETILAASAAIERAQPWSDDYPEL